MKSVLIAIQPYWVFLIIAKIMGWEIDQEKTVEVRKAFPKDLNWNKKAIIYCSKKKQSFNLIPKKYQPLMKKFLGKVIGEFICRGIMQPYGNLNLMSKLSCVSVDELVEYSNGKTLYGWRITDLVIYDKPRELEEFIVPSKIGCCNEGKCRGCKYFDKGNGFNVEDDCNAKFCTDEYKPLRKAPQSWRYVEELGV